MNSLSPGDPPSHTNSHLDLNPMTPCEECAPLSTEPVSTLSDQEYWPDHVCISTAIACLKQWGNYQWSRFGLYPPAITVPMPIGARSLELFAVRYGWDLDYTAANFAAMPFDAWET